MTKICKKNECIRYSTNVSVDVVAECQPYWIALVHMCLGGQRLQVTAGIKMDSLKWTTSGEEIILQTEKTTRKNMEGIPVPQALQMYLTYWTKYVVTACRKRDTIQSIWLSSLGEPLEYKEVSKSIKKVAQIFNPDLTVTAIEFRRMAITNFFKESQEFIQSNTKNLADWLNVSEEVMRQHYNRASAHNRVQEMYQRTTGKSLNLSTELKDAAITISHQLQLGVSSSKPKKIQRLVRLTDNDEQWNAYLAEVKKKKKKTKISDNKNSSSSSHGKDEEADKEEADEDEEDEDG
jgi:hypothetical protein